MSAYANRFRHNPLPSDDLEAFLFLELLYFSSVVAWPDFWGENVVALHTSSEMSFLGRE